MRHFLVRMVPGNLCKCFRRHIFCSGLHKAYIRLFSIRRSIHFHIYILHFCLTTTLICIIDTTVYYCTVRTLCRNLNKICSLCHRRSPRHIVDKYRLGLVGRETGTGCNLGKCMRSRETCMGCILEFVDLNMFPHHTTDTLLRHSLPHHT